MANTINPIQRAVSIVAFLSSLIINGLAGSTTVLNGWSTGQVSDAYPNLFAPAGFTFAIWGLIYVMLGAFSLYTYKIIIKSNRLVPKASINQVLKYFTVVSILNGLWLLSWQYEVFILSILLMFGMLVFLGKIMNTLHTVEFGSKKEEWVVQFPFSVYFGWITVATIANITTTLVSLNWNAFYISEQIWTVIVLILGATIGLYTAYKFKDYVYLVVLIWAYAGIAVKHLDQKTGFSGQFTAVLSLLYVTIPVFIIYAVYLYHERTNNRQEQ